MAPAPCTQIAKGAVAALALFLTANLSAQVWTGTTSTDWNTASNWDTGVPAGSADVFIDLQPNMPVLSSGTTNLGGHQIWVGNQNVVSVVSPPATLSIQSGAQLTSGAGNIGANYNYGDSPGAVTVTGAGSKWTNTSILMGYYVNLAGNGGSLSILNGGNVVTSSGASIGIAGSATATVDGAGSKWTLGGGIDVADEGLGLTSSLTVSNGGYVSTISTTNLATLYNGKGYITLTGAGTKWDTQGDFNVGGWGSGILTISAGAKLNMLGSGNGTVGNTPYSSSGPSSVTITGAGSTWNPFALTVGGTSSSGSLTISNGGTLTTTVARLDTGSGNAGGAAVSIFGQGSTWVNNGHDWNFDIGASGSGSLTLGSGGRLTTLGLTLGSGSELHFQLGGTSALTDYGSINFSAGASLAALGGLLDVTLVNSFNPNPGATFHLFNFNGVPVTGTFATITLPTLPGGETWDTSGLYTDGTIVADAAAVPEPASSAALLGAAILVVALRRSTKRA